MRLAAVVLAAGKATRFGDDKLSALLEGEPLLYHAIRAARAAPVERVVVVAREGQEFGNWPGTPPIELVSLASDELSTSLKAGLAVVPETDGVFIFLGDMPRVTHDLASELAAALADNFAAVPRHEGCTGHPVLLSARSYPQIAQLTGDAGAGKLLKSRDDIAYVDSDDPGILLDVDRPEDLNNV